jgi:low affinity Fe/Cu permease
MGAQNMKMGPDIENTLDYFIEKQEEDPEFFYTIDKDDEGQVRHILGSW